MRLHECDIAIIGGGCIGSSILYELSQRHIQNVTLIDYGRATLSATANSGGMTRVFHENTLHIHLALNHYERLKSLQKLNILTERKAAVGSLYFFNKRRYTNYKKNLNQLKQSHHPFEVLTSVSGKKHFPQYCWKNTWAIYEPSGNQYSATRFADDLLVASIKHGATIIDQCEVHRIGHNRKQYQLIGTEHLISTRMLILAGGARLLPQLNRLGLNLNLQIKNIELFFSKLNDRTLPWPNYFDRESLNFGNFRESKIFFSDRNCPRLQNLPLNGQVHAHSATDIYAPNRLGFLGKVPGFPNLYIATGWGGTAFKFALEIGHQFVNMVQTHL